MRCQHLSHYCYGQNGSTVASCLAKGSPYVPSLCDLEKFCQSGRHALCPSYLVASLGGPSLAAAVEAVIASPAHRACA
ncbi:MAG: hypothetical protein AB1413_11205 [Thermodesulfobacteriota bacterium]